MQLEPASPFLNPVRPALRQEVFEIGPSSLTVQWRAHFASIQSQLSRSLFTQGDTLGTGTFGRVRLVHYDPTAAIAALQSIGSVASTTAGSSTRGSSAPSSHHASHHATPLAGSRNSSIQPLPPSLSPSSHSAVSAGSLSIPPNLQGPLLSPPLPLPAASYFALKMLKKSEIVRLKQVEHIKAETSILSRITHPFIVSLYSTFQDEHHLYMVMDYIIGGELFSQLRRVGRFNNDTARFFTAEIVLALQYLHSKGQRHRQCIQSTAVCALRSRRELSLARSHLVFFSHLRPLSPSLSLCLFSDIVYRSERAAAATSKQAHH